MKHALARLGWTSDTAQRWNDAALTDQPARVVRVDRGLVTVVNDDGEHRLPLTGKLRSSELLPTVGDWVSVTDDAVTAVVPRRNPLVRKDPDRSSGMQVIASDVDVVIVAVPLTEQVRVRKLERYVAFARSSGAEALVVLTKSDLAEDLAASVADARVAAGDAPVLPVSCLTGQGLEAVDAYLHEGRTIVVVGPSGAGKSTLANALGAEREQATGAIRDDGKGRHTTTARELVRLRSGALLIDTPGLRSLELFDAEDAISATYTEITELAQQCRFRDCGHGTEPGCAVNAAVLDGRITGDRIDGYAKLQREEERLAAKVDSRVRAERNKRLRAFHRSLKDQPSR